ncbi:hypothetical protein GFL15_28530 [Rhizobium leguminosarum bv. viciae]|nr:hypothetical protein [Rhizobium leguminosarum bv. viciae]
MSLKRMENSQLIGRGGLLGVVCRAETFPPNLAEICLKGRKTRRFRSSRTADIADLRLQINYHR